MSTEIQRQRHVEVPGTTNLRNTGGYPAEDGRSVKWGVLYRGDQLSDVPLDKAKAILVDQLHIHDTFDFRAPAEVQMKSYSIEGIERHSNAVDSSIFADYVRSGKPFTAEAVRELYEQTYKAFVREHAAVFGGVVKSIVKCQPSEKKAVMVHCTAGKDRTGIICYLILRLIGVKMESIQEDYLLTNQYYKIPEFADKYMDGLKMDDECRKVFWSVDARFLRAAEEEIQSLGGFPVYVKDHLKVTDSQVKQLKDILLQ